MRESRRDFQRVWEGWEAGFMAFHAFHTLSFPWPERGIEVAEACFGGNGDTPSSHLKSYMRTGRPFSDDNF
jgi:hypothetical protein